MNLNRITTKLKIETDLSPEQSGIRITNYVINNLAHTYRFGSHTVEDMFQYGWQFAAALVEGSGYDSNKPFENYLYRHIRNRYLNLQRDQFFRNQPPCLKCPLYNKALPSKCEKYDDRLDCQPFRAWDNVASDRKSLAGDYKYIDFDQSDHRTPDPVAGASYNELADLVETKLSPDMLILYKKLKNGGDVTEDERSTLLVLVTEILYGAPQEN